MVTGAAKTCVDRCKVEGYEWDYYWGRLSNGKFFHAAHFRNGEREFSHLSYDGQFVEGVRVTKHQIVSPLLSLDMKATSEVVRHGREQYSIPYLEGKGKVTADVWYDHEEGKEVSSEDWQWLAFKFTGGRVCGVIYQRECAPYAKWIIAGVTFPSLPNINLEAGMCLSHLGHRVYVVPIQPEMIFHPKTGGRPYSEQPFILVDKRREVGSVEVGYGMWERTYAKSGLGQDLTQAVDKEE